MFWTAMQSIWLVGGDENARYILSKGFPVVVHHTPVLMPNVPLEDMYKEEFNLSTGAPSTGFVGMASFPSNHLLHAADAAMYALLEGMQ